MINLNTLSETERIHQIAFYRGKLDELVKSFVTDTVTGAIKYGIADELAGDFITLEEALEQMEDLLEG